MFRLDDTGPGISPDQRERVFGPFYRALGPDEFGSGLGLSIVKTIADRIGAGVSLAQSGGGGRQVVVSIPRSSICNGSG